jgi:uncharacterized FAD-dependent dehydrogenase
MCPGGMVVPATAYSHSNIVNGMSLYRRNSKYANAAVVAGVHPNELLNKESTPLEAIDWLEELEQKFYNYTNNYNAVAVRISDFIDNISSNSLPESSYPFDLVTAEVNELLPKRIIESLQQGLFKFTRKLKSYDQGVLIGLESKTSSPVQALRDKKNYTCGYQNLYIAGEGSGWAGGIISSAADGIKAALALLKRN